LTAKIIGVTGAIASGKSTVARILEELGAIRISADDIARELLQEDDVRNAIEKVWGSSVFEDSGEVNRKALAEKVFASSDEVQRLNAIVHPTVIKRIRQKIESVRREHPSRPIVLDAALLHEAGVARDCDVVLYVDAEEERRQERARLQRGWDEGEIPRRERLQMPARQKKLRADYVIENNGDMAGTRERVLKFWKNVVTKS